MPAEGAALRFHASGRHLVALPPLSHLRTRRAIGRFLPNSANPLLRSKRVGPKMRQVSWVGALVFPPFLNEGKGRGTHVRVRESQKPTLAKSAWVGRPATSQKKRTGYASLSIWIATIQRKQTNALRGWFLLLYVVANAAALSRPPLASLWQMSCTRRYRDQASASR
jgi:hypothetical protein